MNAEILRNYQELAQKFLIQSESKKKQLKLIAWARFISFLVIFISYFYFEPYNGVLAISVAILFLSVFLFLIKKFIQTECQLVYFKRLTEINQNEIRALQRDLSPFDSGNEFIDSHHDYSYDLDLFGSTSFFQFLNRTVTTRGKNQLATLLNISQRPIDEMKEKQSAIQELAEKLEWRQDFMAQGKEPEEKKAESQIDEIIHQFIPLKSAKILPYLLKILPAVTLLLIAISIAGLIPFAATYPAIFSQWFIFILYSKTISKFKKQFELQAKILSQQAKMLQKIEQMPAKSAYLIQLRNKLSYQGKTASSITSALEKILNEFDYRQNIPVGFILNSVMLWDVRCISRMYNWQQQFSTELPNWFEVIAETDALISLANFNYNHPEWVVPKISDAEFQLKAENLGHPLIDENRCVTNSFQISGKEQIVIITGANMAGKSTFLRTVGINLILASNGCKVCAASFEFSPVRIYTNMRTSDNLMNDESYFYAELLRLQSMLELLRKGEKLFVIVDEMLKGTNSIDKLNGSKELINQLISLKTHGIVATHDLSLTELAHKFPDQIKNLCFEVQLQQDELIFDYQLTNGVTRTMNATFLMKKMGIIPSK